MIFIIVAIAAIGSSDDVDEAVDALTDKPGVVRVQAPAGRCWSGAFVDRTIDGCGPRTITIEEEDIIVANAQKQTPGRWPLTLTLTVDGEIKDRSQTTAQFGVVTVSEG